MSFLSLLAPVAHGELSEPPSCQGVRTLTAEQLHHCLADTGEENVTTSSTLEFFTALLSSDSSLPGTLWLYDMK